MAPASQEAAVEPQPSESKTEEKKSSEKSKRKPKKDEVDSHEKAE
jgi:hypothetical protein